MSEEKTEKTTEKTAENTTENKTEKKSWFNRVLSAITGLIVGIAAMFGVNQTKINEIQNDAKAAYENVQKIQTAIENKDYVGAVSAATDAATSLKKVVGNVKEASETVKQTYEVYKADVIEIKTAIEANDWSKAHDKAVSLLAKLVEAYPGDQLTGTAKSLYDYTKAFIKDLEDKKYDAAVDFSGKMLKLFDTTTTTK